MNGIITGNIASFAEQFTSVIEKHVKSGQFITAVDNLDEKHLTISISAAIANGIDIYNIVRDMALPNTDVLVKEEVFKEPRFLKVLYVYFFHSAKKGKKNLDARDQSHTPESDKEIIINYKDAVAYNITFVGKGVANISKNLKKHKLEMIARLDELHTLYKFMNKYLFMIDTNGVLFYYPDSINITSLKSWIESSIIKNNLAISTIPDGSITLDKYLLLNKFVSLECHLDTAAYGLYDIQGCDAVSSNVAITTSTDIQIQNNQNNQSSEEESQQHSHAQSDGSNAGIDASYSALGYILSWLNPLAYYTSNSSNTSSSTSSSISSSTSTNPENKTIDNDNDISNDKHNTSYFLDTSLQNYDLIKIQDNQVKILKAQKIDIPAFITDITIDNVDNIIISGHINNQPITMKYNKYMLGMHLI